MPLTKKISSQTGWISLGYRLLTSALLFGLIYELLHPWNRAAVEGLVYIPQLLLLTTIVVLLWSACTKSIVLQIVGYIIILLGMLYYNFSDDGTGIFVWLSQLPQQYGDAIGQVLQYGLLQLDDLLRITFLIIGWTMLLISFQQLIWQFYAASSLLVLVAVYLTTLHLFFGINIYGELLRTTLYSALLTALTAYMKRRSLLAMARISSKTESIQQNAHLDDSESENDEDQRKQHWFVSNRTANIATILALLLIPTLLLSYNKEKTVEVADWTKTVTSRFINDMAALSTPVSGQPLSRASSFQSKLASGYSTNDDKLGGTVQLQPRAVFQAWSSQPVYWRGEAKMTYTGKGWEDDSRYFTLHQQQEKDEAVLAWTSPHQLRGNLLYQELQWLAPVSQMPLFHGGVRAVVTELNAVEPERKLINYIEDEWTSNLYAPTERALVSSYHLVTELPITDEAVLREIEPLESELAEFVWLHEGLEQYLQLPEQLPVRVTALATEIAGGGLTSRYDQVKAVEQYIKETYTYSLKSEAPKGSQDFVDHFLFEQQQGYCVHFATSMVVLLRTQGIPARYVKGYLPGEAIDQRTSEHGFIETLYEVGEQDAHAWVEVYFPGAGWVPFDPTPSSESSVASSTLFQSIMQGMQRLNIEGKWNSVLSFVQSQRIYFVTGIIAWFALMLLLGIFALLSRSGLILYMQYGRAYRKMADFEGRMKQHRTRYSRQHDMEMPSRTEGKVLQKQTQQWQKEQQQYFKTLAFVLETIFVRQLTKLERRTKRKGLVDEKRSMTYRGRIEQLSSYYRQPTIDLLLSLCIWIETIHYSSYKIEEIVPLLPLPKQLAQFSRHIRVDLSLSE